MTTHTCFDVEIRDKIAHIRLKRPEAFNTMNRAFWNELPAIVNANNDEAAARVIVISSTGKHFCAGMALDVFATESLAPASARERLAFQDWLRQLMHCFDVLEQARFPVIAAIQGGCIGGALDLAAACDLRVCSADAFFTVQEIQIGMAAAARNSAGFRPAIWTDCQCDDGRSLPPLPLQRESARRRSAIDALQAAQRASLAELDALFASLQHRAFGDRQLPCLVD